MQFLLAITLILSQFAATDKLIEANICSTMIAPTISAPTDGAQLSQPTVDVIGQASANTQVVISIDGSKKVLVTASSGGSYAATITVQSGQHLLSVTSKNPCTTITGDQITITGYKVLSPPRLTPNPAQSRPEQSFTQQQVFGLPRTSIEQEQQTRPSDEASARDDEPSLILTGALEGRDLITTNQSTLTISGQLSSAGTLRVVRDSDDTVLAETFYEDSDFRVQVPLIEGDNNLVLTATIDEDQVVKRVTIVRTPVALVDMEDSQGAVEMIPLWAYIVTGISVVLVLAGLWHGVATWRHHNRARAAAAIDNQPGPGAST